MNQNQCTELIDRLSDKTLSFGCEIRATEKLDTCTHHFDTTVIRRLPCDKLRIYGGTIKDVKINTIVIKKYDIEKIIGHKVYIGDLLKKATYVLPESNVSREDLPYPANSITRPLIAKWGECGFTKSMNELMECGFEKVCQKCNKHRELYEPMGDCCNQVKDKTTVTEQLKDPNVNELFEFINKIL